MSIREHEALRARLASLTPARIGLGREGASLPTREVLRFGQAHALARDAVHEPFRPEAIADGLRDLGFDPVCVESEVASRADYLRRPDLGRTLSSQAGARLTALSGPFDLAFVIADGLSSTAVHAHAVPFLAAMQPHLDRLSVSVAPIVLASQARVALGDAAGEALGARLVAVLIGERPGLSSPDSLGVYLTFAPRRGLTDAARNCISNIRPGGLPLAEGAFKLAWLLEQSLRRGLTGVALKDDSEASTLSSHDQKQLQP